MHWSQLEQIGRERQQAALDEAAHRRLVANKTPTASLGVRLAAWLWRWSGRPKPRPARDLTTRGPPLSTTSDRCR